MGTKTSEIFKKLSALDMSKHIKTLQKQRYVSWSDAWHEVKTLYPMSYYSVAENAEGDPFFVSSMGIFVRVRLTIVADDGSLVQDLNHPVLNGANKTLKEVAYSYKVKEYVQGRPTGKMVEKFIEPATAFDINSAIMRCLTKALALQGEALYVYRDEAMPDLPLVDSTQLQEILDAVKASKMTLKQVTDSWQLDKIASLHSTNFDQMIDWLSGQPK